jgi:TIR domain
MADVFISYAREDANRLAQVKDGLEAAGLSVWCDAEIRPGTHWDTTIEAEISQAKCVLVLWSVCSVESENVQCEAEWARGACVLVPVKLDECELPFFHRRTQFTDLSRWSGDVTDPVWRILLARVRELTGVAADPRADLERWGFGIAPPKPQIWRRYDDAVRHVRAIAQARSVQNRETALGSISEVKGLLNRSRKKDQWDWFIVWQRFGLPTMGHLRRLVEGLEALRSAVKDGEGERIQAGISAIKKQNIVGLSHLFLGEKEIPRDEAGGVVYILATREAADLLFTGVTRGDVIEVADQLTKGLGTRVPFGVFHAWVVNDAATAKNAVFSEFSRRGIASPFDRILADIKALECDAREAVSIVDTALKSAGLLEA